MSTARPPTAIRAAGGTAAVTSTRPVGAAGSAVSPGPLAPIGTTSGPRAAVTGPGVAAGPPAAVRTAEGTTVGTTRTVSGSTTGTTVPARAEAAGALGAIPGPTSGSAVSAGPVPEGTSAGLPALVPGTGRRGTRAAVVPATGRPLGPGPAVVPAGGTLRGPARTASEPSSATAASTGTPGPGVVTTWSAGAPAGVAAIAGGAEPAVLALGVGPAATVGRRTTLVGIAARACACLTALREGRPGPCPGRTAVGVRPRSPTVRAAALARGAAGPARAVVSRVPAAGRAGVGRSPAAFAGDPGSTWCTCPARRSLIVGPPLVVHRDIPFD